MGGDKMDATSNWVVMLSCLIFGFFPRVISKGQYSAHCSQVAAWASMPTRGIIFVVFQQSLGMFLLANPPRAVTDVTLGGFWVCRGHPSDIELSRGTQGTSLA